MSGNIWISKVIYVFEWLASWYHLAVFIVKAGLSRTIFRFFKGLKMNITPFISFLNLIMLGWIAWFIGTTLAILPYPRSKECLWMTIKISKLGRLKVCGEVKVEHFRHSSSHHSLVSRYNLSDFVSIGFSLCNVATNYNICFCYNNNFICFENV